MIGKDCKIICVKIETRKRRDRKPNVIRRDIKKLGHFITKINFSFIYKMIYFWCYIRCPHFFISLFLKFPHLMLLDTHKKVFFNFSSFRLLTLRGLFWFPGYRELFLSTGACAATKEGMENLLRYQCYKTQDISGRIVFYSMKHRFFIYVNFISPRYMSITIYAIILWHGTNSDVYWGLPVFRYKTESNEIYEPKIYLFYKCNI